MNNSKCVKILYENFWGYLQVNLFRVKWVLVFGLLFFAVFCFLRMKGYTRKCNTFMKAMMCDIVLSMNCSFIFVMTLFGRKMGEQYQFEWKPFRSYHTAFVEGEIEILLQILVNIAMYIPIGFLLPCCFKVFEKCRYAILMVVMTSFCIELIQGVFRLGLFESDDIINNMCGVAVGIGMYKLCRIVKLHVH